MKRCCSQNQSEMMKIRILLLTFLSSVALEQTLGQQATYSVGATIEVSETLQSQFNEEGRLFLFLSQNQWAEPRTQIWPGPWTQGEFFATNLSGLDAASAISIDPAMEWIGTADWSLKAVPEGEYRVQVLWDQDLAESGINAPGNLYSTVTSVMIDKDTDLNLVLDNLQQHCP